MIRSMNRYAFAVTLAAVCVWGPSPLIAQGKGKGKDKENDKSGAGERATDKGTTALEKGKSASFKLKRAGQDAAARGSERLEESGKQLEGRGKKELKNAADLEAGKARGKDKAAAKKQAKDKAETKGQAKAKDKPKDKSKDKAKRGIGNAGPAAKETRKHIKRMAKFARVEAIARKKNNETLLAKVEMLRKKELERHRRVLARLATEKGAGRPGAVGTAKEVEEAAKRGKAGAVELKQKGADAAKKVEGAAKKAAKAVVEE